MFPSIDFLPSEYRDRRSRSADLRWRYAVACVTVFLVAAGAFVTGRKLDTLRTEADRVERAAAQVATENKQVRARRERVGKREATFLRLAVVKLRTPRTRLLVEINKSADGIAISSMRLENRKDAEGSRAEIVTLNGLAETDRDVARFVAGLSTNRHFGEVTLLFSRHRHGTRLPMREFSLRIQPRSPRDLFATYRREGRR